jgi:hypothetical protein
MNGARRLGRSRDCGVSAVQPELVEGSAARASKNTDAGLADDNCLERSATTIVSG